MEAASSLIESTEAAINSELRANANDYLWNRECSLTM